jgi:hypothetical protein
MKTTFLFLAFNILCILSYSQEPPKFVYCEIVGTAKILSNKVTIQIDLGQKAKYFEDKRLKDNSGNPIIFNSMIDALNFMGKQGWDFAQAYTVTIGQSNVYHYLLKKPFEKLEENEKAEYLQKEE